MSGPPPYPHPAGGCPGRRRGRRLPCPPPQAPRIPPPFKNVVHAPPSAQYGGSDADADGPTMAAAHVARRGSAARASLRRRSDDGGNRARVRPAARPAPPAHAPAPAARSGSRRVHDANRAQRLLSARPRPGPRKQLHGPGAEGAAALRGRAVDQLLGAATPRHGRGRAGRGDRGGARPERAHRGGVGRKPRRRGVGRSGSPSTMTSSGPRSSAASRPKGSRSRSFSTPSRRTATHSSSGTAASGSGSPSTSRRDAPRSKRRPSASSLALATALLAGSLRRLDCEAVTARD